MLVGKGIIEGVGSYVMCHNKNFCVGASNVKIVEIFEMMTSYPTQSFYKVLSDSLNLFEAWNICDLTSNIYLEKHKVLLSLFCFFLC